MDIYDSMLDSIQQFPLDANYFERRIKRINKTYARHLAAYTRILQRLPQDTHRSFAAAKHRLERCIDRKQKIIKKFLECIDRQTRHLEEYNKISGDVLAPGVLHPSGSSVLQTKENGVLESKICVCNSTDGGTIICCDSSACQTRWYHCRCVAVTSVPADGWLCEKCRKLE